MKDRQCPFPDNRVHQDSVVPDPLIFFIESEEMKDGSIRESAVYLPTTEYQKTHKVSHDAFSLNQLLDAGVDLKLTNPRLLNSSDPTDYPTQQEMLSAYQSQKAADQAAVESSEE